MNSLKSTLVRIAVAVLLLAAALAPAASAQPLATSTFRIFVDQDPAANLGCSKTTTLGTVLSGIDQIVTITFQYTPAPTYTGVQRQVCSGGSFGPPELTPTPLAFGPTSGVGGSTGIETSVPLPSAPTGGVRLYFDSIYTGSVVGVNRDELISLNGDSNGPPILVQGGVPIPTLSEWGLILLALLLTTSGFLVIRRRGDRRRAVIGLLLMALGLGAGIAWAGGVGLVVDGNTSDWTPANSTQATDQPGDAQPNSDIVAGFGGLQGSTLFLRMDVRFSGTPVSNRPPVVNNATFSLPENSSNGTVVGTVTFTDPDLGQNHSFAITGGNTGGAFAIDPSTGEITVVNSAALDFETTPTFTLTVQVTDDGTPVQSGTGTVTVNLTNVDDVNPTAVADTATVGEDSGATPIPVLANDTDGDGGPISISAVTQPANGTVVITGGGTGLTYAPNANYCNNPSGSPDTFTYTLTPGGSTATVSVTVTCADDPPTAVADTATVGEDSGANPIPVLANDTDGDGGPISVASVTQPANGVVVITGGGTGLTYAPNANYCNSVSGTPDTFTYTLTPGGSSTTVTVTVTCVDDGPTAVADSATVAEDSGATPIPVLANDTDGDGGPISIQSVTQPANGTVVITGGGTGLTYAPNANYCNSVSGPVDTFTYTLTPGGSSATVSVTVTCVDDPPTAVADTATVLEDSGATTIPVLANDTDGDGGPISISSVTQPANGAVVITGGGTGLTYAPNANYCNSVSGTPDTFTYTLTPGGSSTTVSVTVTCADDPPAAVNDAATVAEDSGATAIPVLANDTDLDGGPISIQSVTQPANGAVTITGGGTGLTYTPNTNYCNTPPGTTPDTFTYTLMPGGSTATVSVSVTCVNDAPVVDLDSGDVGSSDFAATYTEGTPGVLIEDENEATVTDVDNTTLASLTVTITNLFDTGSEILTADVTGTSITANYVAATGVLTLTGPDTVTNFQTVLRTVRYQNTDVDPDTTPRVIHFVANDGTVDSNTATSTVTVTAIDTPPTAVADTATVAEDSVANPPIPVLANDTDPDNGPISVASVTQPANGTVVIMGGGVSYTPNANYCNSVSGPVDTFTYTLSPGSSSATVSVTVTCADDNPVAVADSATVVEDSGPNPIPVLANDTDVDGGPISIGSVTQPANGAVVITGGGTGLTYAPNANYCNTPPGTFDTFTYTLTPGGSSATVSVTVTCVDDNPTAVADAATVVEDSGANPIPVLANDTDPDGGPISISAVTQPVNGAVVITGGGTGVSYTPNANYCNTPPGTFDTFTYTLTPGGSSATVSVSVTCVDDNPVAVADTATVVEDSGANPIPVLANDTDIDGGPKSVASVTQPANGTVVITGGGTGLTYAPNANYCNSVSGPADTFTYTLAPGGSSTTVTVTVTCVDDNPVAVADVATVVEDSGANPIPVLANDTDVDGGPISVNSVTQPANGAVAITGGGTGVSYTPNANYCNSVSGPADTFTYTLAPGGSSTTVSVTVTCVDDNPVAVADAATVVEDSVANAINVLANDTDVDGGPKSVNSVTQPANGTVAITGGGTGVSYTPNANYCNSVSGPADTFTYTLAPGGSSTTVSVTVTCVDDPPVAVADSATVIEDSVNNAIPVLANDTDVDGGPKSISAVTQPANGAVVITGGGTGLNYTPNANYCNNPPGTFDTFSYTLTPGGSSTTVSVSVTCVNDPPVAGSDTFDTIGNTELRVDLGAGPTPAVLATTPSAFGVLNNDSDPVENNAIVVTGIVGCADTTAPFGDSPACATANGGTVVMESNGKFSYKPKAGDTAASDTFQYTIQDNGVPAPASATGTVTINRLQRVWYVKNNAPAGGQGRSHDPFDTLAEAQAASLVNDYIFVYFGDGTTNGQAAGIVLKNGQHLIGEYAGLRITFNPAITFNGVAGTTFVQLVAQPAADACSGNPCRPLLDNSAAGGNAVSATDAIPAEVTGLSLAGNTNAIDLTTNAAFAGSGLFEIRNNVVRSSGIEGFDINQSGTGSLELKIHDNAITAGVRGIDVLRTGGTCTISDFGNNVITGNTGGSGIEITGVTFDGAPGLPITQVSGGATVIGQSGNGVSTNGMLLTNVVGELVFADLDIFNDAGAGLRVTSTGQLNAGAGTGFRIAVGNVSTVDSNGGPAVDVNNASVSLPFSFLRSTNSTTTGLSLVNAFGGAGGTALSVSSGQIADPVGASGTAVNISGGNGNITLGIPIINTSGNAIAVASRTSDTVSFTSTVNETGSGISLTGNTGATISFTGAITANTNGNAAFTATGGGTVTATDTTSTLTTTTGTALNVANTTIGAGGLKFQRISAGTAASGPANGIVLNATGSSGGLTVSGTGAAGSGGTIQKTTGTAIALTSTQAVNLSSMNISSPADDGINGTSVNGLTLTGCNITNAGNSATDEGIELNNPTGTLTFTNTAVTGSAHNHVKIDANNVSVAAINVTGCTFSNNKTSGVGANGFLLSVRGTSTLGTSTVSNTAFSDTVVSQLKVDAGDTATVSSFTAQNCTFSGISGNAVDFTQAQSANATYRLLNNATITGHQSQAINIFSSSTTTGGSIQARIQGNVVGNAGSAGSGSATGSGIRVLIQGKTAGTVLVDGNVIRQVPQARGIDAQFLGPTTSGQTVPVSDITVTNNDVNPQDSTGFPVAAIYVAADSQGGSTVTVRSDIRGNTVPAGTAFDVLPTYLVLDKVVAAAVCQLVDTPPASANATAQLTSTNTGSASAAAGCALIAGPINTPP